MEIITKTILFSALDDLKIFLLCVFYLLMFLNNIVPGKMGRSLKPIAQSLKGKVISMPKVTMGTSLKARGYFKLLKF